MAKKEWSLEVTVTSSQALRHKCDTCAHTAKNHYGVIRIGNMVKPEFIDFGLCRSWKCQCQQYVRKQI